MQLVSLNVAKPKAVDINGKTVMTGIYKLPEEGPVWVGETCIVGDGQADHKVHGGPHQVAYCYPQEHYAYWQEMFDFAELPLGSFGENFTVTGLDEADLCIGDTLNIGQAIFQVSMPRIPCYKLAHKLGEPIIVKHFLHSGKSGFYLRVLKEGYVKNGDEITIQSRDPQGVSVYQALILSKLDLDLLDEDPVNVFRKAFAIDSLASLLREEYSKRLDALNFIVAG